MAFQKLKQTEKAIKDLILFDSSWKNTNLTSQFSTKTLKRLRIYKELVKNSFDSLFISIYPHTYSLIKKNWSQLYKKYIKEFPPKSPILNRVAKEFPGFLAKQKNIIKTFPFIGELAKYEWLEVEVYEREEPILKNGQKSDALNPIHEICKFEYPITQIVNSIENKKPVKNTKKVNLSLLIYRDPKELKIRLFELAPGTLAYIELLKRDLTHKEAVDILLEFFKIGEKEKAIFKKNMLGLQKVLKQNKIIV